jgi:hypothetical protein
MQQLPVANQTLGEPCLKLNGVIQEIIEHPNVDVAELLQDRLGVPADKAEALAERIKKQYCQKASAQTPQKPVRLLEEPDSDRNTNAAYSFDALSLKEFEHFLFWLLEELGYEVQPGKQAAALGVDFLAVKNGEKVAVVARKLPKTCQVTDSIFAAAEQAKRRVDCESLLIVATSYFSEPTTAKAEAANIELWDLDAIARKISEVKKAAVEEEKTGFPQYKGTLLQSLLRLEETKDFIIEPRGEKYDLHLPGVKFPLLTFQSCDGEVTRCIFRIIRNEPVSEFAGIPLIGKGEDGKRSGPEGAEAYSQITEYLEQFLQQ